FDDERVAIPAGARGAVPLPEARREVGPAVERDDPRVVHHFRADDEVIRRLEDLQVVVVAAWNNGRAGIEADDAPVPDGQIFRVGGDVPRLGERILEFLPSRRQRWNSSVPWIDDDRRTLRLDDGGS